MEKLLSRTTVDGCASSNAGLEISKRQSQIYLNVREMCRTENPLSCNDAENGANVCSCSLALLGESKDILQVCTS